MNINTTYKADQKGAGKIIARSSTGKQKTVSYDHSVSTAVNHGRAAADLALRSVPTGSIDRARETSTHEYVGNGKHRFTFDV